MTASNDAGRGGSMGKPSDGYRYRAFISYSWADAKWGKWLQHAIETYRTPKALIGEERAHGPVPARLNPLFKDREEEAAGSSIGAAVEAALGSSEFLIVVCSPNSAKSQWVNREIAWFKTHRDPSKVLALIVGGTRLSMTICSCIQSHDRNALPSRSIFFHESSAARYSLACHNAALGVGRRDCHRPFSIAGIAHLFPEYR